MSQTDQNQDLLRKLRGSVAAFAACDMDLDGIHSTMTLLENDAADAAPRVRLAEADVEEIRFTTLLAEQRPAVLRWMQELVAELPDPAE
jgi:hypothetical protein